MKPHISKKSVFGVLTIIILVFGVLFFMNNNSSITNENVDGYFSGNLMLDVPPIYSITPPSTENPMLTLEHEESGAKMQVFRMKDFGDGPPELTEDMMKYDTDKRVPKDYLTVGSEDNIFNVWLFYKNNDEVAMEELMGIYSSIEIK